MSFSLLSERVLGLVLTLSSFKWERKLHFSLLYVKDEKMWIANFNGGKLDPFYILA
jgi:hypothetical protein